MSEWLGLERTFSDIVFNDNLYIGIPIFPRIDNTQSRRHDWKKDNKKVSIKKNNIKKQSEGMH